ALARQAEFLGPRGRIQRRTQQRLARHMRGVPGVDATGVLVHQGSHHRLVERAPVRADAHRLVVAQRLLDDRGELALVLLAETDVAGVDAVLGQYLGTGRLAFQQLMTVVVKVADDRHLHPHHRQPFGDARHRRRRGRGIDRDAHQFGAGAGQFGDLLRGAGRVLGVGIGHRLHHDRRTATHLHLSDLYAYTDPARVRLGRTWFPGLRFTHGIDRIHGAKVRGDTGKDTRSGVPADEPPAHAGAVTGRIAAAG